MRGTSLSSVPPDETAGRLVLLYTLHILTTILLPIVLFALGLLNSIQMISLILLLAGLWTLIGVPLMMSEDTRQFRRAYTVFGIILMVLAGFLYVASLR